jgi:HD superfamily phosphohydrolase
MFNQTLEEKVLRDPIHEYIHVDLQLIWDLINSREVQRLRRIHQLGVSMMVYHTAEHSRFSHSLGVYEITRRMIDEVSGLKDQLSDFEQVALLCAALLHDVGHGPFSHAFENVSHVHHETLSIQLITQPSHINSILVEADSSLPQVIADILSHQYKKSLVSQIISGPIDADRMDYLLRDAYFTGTSYGQFDIERILRTLRVEGERLVVKESGVHAIEDYIMARYHMYWQVYYHPVSRSTEVMISSLFQRMKDCIEQGIETFDSAPFIQAFLSTQLISNETIMNLDEVSFLSLLMTLQTHQDSILSDLSSRVLHRRLFGYVDFKSNKQKEKLIDTIVKAGYDPKYYFDEDKATQAPYRPYKEDQQSQIWISTLQGLKELSTVSVIVAAIVKGKEKEDIKLYAPKECL